MNDLVPLMVGFALGEIRALAWSVYKRKRARRNRYLALALDLSAVRKHLDGFGSRQFNPTTLHPATRTLADAARRIAEHRSALAEVGDEDLYGDLDLLHSAVTEIENISDPSYQVGENVFEVRLLTVLGLAKGLGEFTETLRQRVREKV